MFKKLLRKKTKIKTPIARKPSTNPSAVNKIRVLKIILLKGTCTVVRRLQLATWIRQTKSAKL